MQASLLTDFIKYNVHSIFYNCSFIWVFKISFISILYVLKSHFPL